MSGNYNRTGHAVCDIKYHIIWTTKYRYKILGGKMSRRLRELIWQGCEARGIRIVSGNISKDHVHLLLSCPPGIAPRVRLYNISKGGPHGCCRRSLRN